MTWQQKWRGTAAFRAVAAVIVVAGMTACGDGAPPPATWERRSGEEVFRGLVFGEGVVAAQFPEVFGNLPRPELTPEQKATQEAAKTHLIAEIRHADPAFFDRFGEALQSGDHLRIERALNQSTGTVRLALREMTPTIAGRGDAQGQCVAATVTLAVTAVMAANFAWVVNFYQSANVVQTSNVYETTNYWSSGETDGSTYGGTYDGTYGDTSGDDPNDENAWTGPRLKHDEMIAMIATRLAAR